MLGGYSGTLSFQAINSQTFVGAGSIGINFQKPEKYTTVEKSLFERDGRQGEGQEGRRVQRHEKGDPQSQ